MDLSVVIPAYNEGRRIGATLQAIHPFFREKLINYEVIVADDGSTDRTREVARRNGASVVTIPHQGKGAAAKAGVLATQGKWILLVDADNSIPIETFDSLWEKQRGHPVVIASRFLEESRLESQAPVRIIISKLANISARLLLALPFADTQAGFKLFRGWTAKRIFRKVTIPGFGFDLEVLTLAQSLGLPVAEVPIVWRDARRSQLRALRAIPRAGLELLQILWNLEQGRYGFLPFENKTPRQFLKFSMIGVVNALVDFAVLNALVRYLGVRPLVAGTVSILVAIVHSFFWNDLWAFRGEAPKKSRWTRFGQFFLVQGIGNGLHWLAFAALYAIGFHYNLAKLLAIVISTIWNFTGNKWWVFRR